MFNKRFLILGFVFILAITLTFIAACTYTTYIQLNGAYLYIIFEEILELGIVLFLALAVVLIILSAVVDKFLGLLPGLGWITSVIGLWFFALNPPFVPLYSDIFINGVREKIVTVSNFEHVRTKRSDHWFIRFSGGSRYKLNSHSDYNITAPYKVPYTMVGKQYKVYYLKDSEILLESVYVSK